MSYTIKGDADELAVPILGEDINGDKDYFVRDTYTGSIGAMGSAHLKGHQGKGFYAYYYNSALTNGSSAEIVLANPAASYPHVVIYILTEGNSEIFTFEGTTTSADGTSIASINRNRNSANTADLVVTHTPTITADGTEIYHDYIIGGIKNKATGGTDGFSDEIIMKPSTKYLIRVTNDSGADEIVSVSIHWYE